MGETLDDQVPHDTASSLVRHLAEIVPDNEELTIGQLLSYLGVHGFVVLMLVLALLNIAIFMLPGLSILFGLPMVILGVQMLLGLSAPIFPAFVRDQTIAASAVHKGLSLAINGLEKLERSVRPRLLILTHPSFVRVHYLAALILSLLIAIPVPFLNLPPSVAIILLAIGLMQRDGLFICGAYLFGLWSLRLYASLGHAAHNLVGFF